MNFLSNVLREDGGFEYKKAIVDAILILIREIPDAKESGLSHLCEFIEARAAPAPPARAARAAPGPRSPASEGRRWLQPDVHVARPACCTVWSWYIATQPCKTKQKSS
jgi:hypothetical protein